MRVSEIRSLQVQYCASGRHCEQMHNTVRCGSRLEAQHNNASTCKTNHGNGWGRIFGNFFFCTLCNLFTSFQTASLRYPDGELTTLSFRTPGQQLFPPPTIFLSCRQSHIWFLTVANNSDVITASPPCLKRPHCHQAKIIENSELIHSYEKAARWIRKSKVSEPRFISAFG